MAPPPASAVADAMNVPATPRDSQTNVDIMAVTKGFHWPWLLAFVLPVSGVVMALVTRHPSSGASTSSPSCSGSESATREP